MTVEKIPTILHYDNGGTTGVYRWGYQAQQYAARHGTKMHEWFKLGLCNDFEERRARESELMRKYKSQTALPVVKDDECMSLVVNYLSSVKGAVDQFFHTQYGEDAAQCPRDYIITVPALWDHAEQEKTRLCAERAGMGEGSQLQLVPEPEAACIYAIQQMLWINEGDTFVICDAGGGTVDLASYTIESLKRDQILHCKLAGAATGSGGLCGSSFLNRIFQAYLEKKLEDYPAWDSEFMVEALRAFEDQIKPEFTDEHQEEKVIRIHGLKESKPHGVAKNILILTTEELRKHVFDEVISKIEGLVRDQINNTRRPVTAVLLAGGFGKNPYLKRRLEQIDAVVRNKIRVQRIDNGDTAIARGALVAGLAGLGKNLQPEDDDGAFNVISTRTVEVVSRLAGRHYGTAALESFEEGVDPESRRQHRKKRDDGDKIEKITWFARKGETIPDGEPLSFDFCKVAKVQRGVPAHQVCTPVIRIYTCENDIPGTYRDDASVREIAKFKMDLRGLSIPTITKGAQEFYEARFDIEMTLRAASLSFCGVYGKGTPEAKRFPATNVVFT
ncbi:putative Hsp70 family chaperone [Paraphaeosphaeria sporulosa]|uniref:Putative Hsp70 family chaperone n=1 Tax=Paraphaeosphaeria sporulosa TaxID=1460663 RepID=A0A177CW65_9PLEO|nr:putative Hsp70 family chaperone [Paraphaeosphaeria sporulosa]OAG11476.1 putative Hsp70 family chaperone [Paraphaeosphaeria sporulosa]